MDENKELPKVDITGSAPATSNGDAAVPSSPLSAYYRQPKIYVSLPSKGNYYVEGALDKSEDGTYAVYSMTAKDELMFKTPDALLSGQSTVAVINSCIPSIKDPWKLPTIDLDAILVAIRIATYGENMDIDTECPACKEEQRYGFDLTKYLEGEYETLLIGGNHEKSEKSSMHILENLGINPIIIPEMQRSINPVLDRIALKKIRKIIEDFKPDIVHTHAAKAGALGRKAAYNAGVKQIYHTFHGHIFHSYFGKIKTLFEKLILVLILRLVCAAEYCFLDRL